MKKILIIIPILFTRIINSTEINWNKALIKAARDNDIYGVQKALANGANVNHKNNSGYTSLMLSDDKELAEILIKSGADLNLQNALSESALLIALMKNKKDVAELLIKAGTDLNLQNQWGYTALIYAAAYYYRLEIVKLLLEAGADTTIKNKNGESFLDLIQEAKHFAIKKVYEDYAIEHRIAIAAKLALFLTKDTAGVVAGYCA